MVHPTPGVRTAMDAMWQVIRFKTLESELDDDSEPELIKSYGRFILDYVLTALTVCGVGRKLVYEGSTVSTHGALGILRPPTRRTTPRLVTADLSLDVG